MIADILVYTFGTVILALVAATLVAMGRIE
jgi:hypothetical protein